MRLLLLLLTTLIITGCQDEGGDASDPSKSCGDKDFFSLWTRTDQSATFNLNGLDFINDHVYFTQIGSATCVSVIHVTGSQCSGTINVKDSLWDGSGGSDPGCASLDGDYDYTKSSAGLRACKNNQCGNYE